MHPFKAECAFHPTHSSPWFCSCCACCCLSCRGVLQTLSSENMEDYVGYELPAKFLEVDEVSAALHFGGWQTEMCMQTSRRHRMC
jgi:hypothetical protein